VDVRTVLAVAAGAAIGGVLRFVITTLVVGRFGPGLGFYATFGINVVGSYLIGLVLGLAQERVDFDPLLRAFLAVGVLGGFYDVLDLRIRGVTLGDSGARPDRGALR